MPPEGASSAMINSMQEHSKGGEKKPNTFEGLLNALIKDVNDMQKEALGGLGTTEAFLISTQQPMAGGWTMFNALGEGNTIAPGWLQELGAQVGESLQGEDKLEGGEVSSIGPPDPTPYAGGGVSISSEVF